MVSHFAKNRDFIIVRELQKQILGAYQNDFSKHVSKQLLPKLIMVWESIPAQLAKENKKFRYGDLKAGGRAKEFEDAIMWLKNSGLIHTIHRLNKPDLPIKSYIEYNAFKMFMLDVGLLSAMSGLDARTLLEGNKIFTEFKGSLAEQFALQELNALSNMEIAYWAADMGAIAEIDFVIQYRDLVVPLEIKSSTNIKSKSLQVYISKFSPAIALRGSLADYKVTDNLHDLPLFMIMTIPNLLDAL